MTSDQPSYGRQFWIYWRWKLVALTAVCGLCFGFVLGIHEMVTARTVPHQDITHAR